MKRSIILATLIVLVFVFAFPALAGPSPPILSATIGTPMTNSTTTDIAVATASPPSLLNMADTVQTATTMGVFGETRAGYSVALSLVSVTFIQGQAQYIPVMGQTLTTSSTYSVANATLENALKTAIPVTTGAERITVISRQLNDYAGTEQTRTSGTSMAAEKKMMINGSAVLS